MEISTARSDDIFKKMLVSTYGAVYGIVMQQIVVWPNNRIFSIVQIKNNSFSRRRGNLCGCLDLIKAIINTYY